MSNYYMSVFKSYGQLNDFNSIEYLALFSLDNEQKILLTEFKRDAQQIFWDIPRNTMLKIAAENENGFGSADIESDVTAEKKDNSGPEKKELQNRSTGGKEQDDPEKPSEGKETEKVYYILRKLETPVNDYFLVLQSKSEIQPETVSLFAFIEKNLAGISTIATQASQERFRNELTKLREFQARLFPKFTSVTALDIASVYLPADLMSGNFIDAFYISDNIYQIVVCSTGGYDAQSSFAGASIRTIIKTNSSVKFAPSGLIKFTVGRIDRIVQGLHSMISLTIIQFNIKSGDARISSFGSPNIMFASKSHKKTFSLNDSQAGKELSKRTSFKDMVIHIEPDDTILYFSTGVTMASSSKGEYFGKERLMKEISASMSEPSLVITQNISEAIYTFTDYGSTQEDIILLAVKRK